MSAATPPFPDEDVHRWLPLVASRFPGCFTPAWRASWQSRPRPARIGQKLHGVVIAVAQFGSWIDAGLGTPVLLHLSRVPANAFGRREHPSLGSDITCWVYAVGTEGEVGATIQFEPGFEE